jgi:hypothetical protein
MVEGTLKSDGTLELDTKLDLSPGRVQVWVRPAPTTEGRAPESLLDFVQRVRRESEARGHRFLTDAEVTAWVEELRADEDRVGKAYRQSSGNP